MKTNSESVNRLFNNFASFLSIEKGIESALAKNLIRWHMGQRKSRTPHKIWTDPRTGLALTVEQWKSPSQRLAEKVVNGTREGFYEVDDAVFKPIPNSLHVTLTGVLVDIERDPDKTFVFKTDIP